MTGTGSGPNVRLTQLRFDANGLQPQRFRRRFDSAA